MQESKSIKQREVFKRVLLYFFIFLFLVASGCSSGGGGGDDSTSIAPFSANSTVRHPAETEDVVYNGTTITVAKDEVLIFTKEDITSQELTDLERYKQKLCLGR